MIFISLNEVTHKIVAETNLVIGDGAKGPTVVLKTRADFDALDAEEGIYYSSAIDFPEEYGFTKEEVSAIIIR